jgi:O-antigen/teichoic acid export membrane protein
LSNAVRNYSTLVAAQAAVALFSFASVWLVTRHLGTEGYGGVVAVIAASQVVQIFVSWTGIALSRYGVEEFVESGHITESFWARTAVFLPNTIVLLLFAGLWLPLLANWLKLSADAVWLVAAHFAATAVWLHIQHAMQAAKLPRLQGMMLAAERILIFAALLAMTAAGRLDGINAIVAYAAAPMVMAIAGLIAIRKLFSWRICITVEAVKKLLRFSVPLIPYSLIGYFSTNYLDAIFISQYLTKADLGVYSVAYQMNGILMQFPLLAGSLLLPLFVTLQTSGKPERVTAYMRDVVPLLTLAAGLTGIIAALFMMFFIPIAFGVQANDAVVIFWILISAAVLAVPILVGFAPFTNAVSATYIASIAAPAAAVVNVLANWLLIPRYGLKGCAWATVLAYAASVVVFVAFGKARFDLAHRWTIPAVLPVVAASAYASYTGDLIAAAVLAFVAAFVIVLIWRNDVKSGLQTLRDYRALVAG